MKNTFAIIALVASFLLVSCNKDDDNQSSITETDLTGSWALTDMNCKDGKMTTTLLGETATTPFTAIGKDYDLTLTLNEADKTFASEGSYTTVTTVVDDEGAETYEEEGDFPLAGTWALDGKTINFTVDGETYPMTIQSMKDGIMVLKQTVDLPLDLFGIETRTQGNFILTWEKQ